MLSEKELATILAALRFFQANFNDLAEMREEMPLHFENVAPLNHNQIDELCERLNIADYLIINAGSDRLSELQIKYLLVEINERNGEKEYTFRCLAQCSSEQNPKLVADAIALNWYDEYLDEDPYDRDSFWFEGGAIAVEVGNVNELPKEHYDVLSLYLSELTPSNTAIAEATAYKSESAAFLLSPREGGL